MNEELVESLSSHPDYQVLKRIQESFNAVTPTADKVFQAAIIDLKTMGLSPVKKLIPKADHRKHKGLNNRAENSHQPTRRREKSLIKMKQVVTAQRLLKLMGLLRNLFAVNVGRYSKSAEIRKAQLNKAFECWNHITTQILCV